MAVEQQEASDNSRQQQPVEKAEPLINRPEMQTLLNDSSSANKHSTTGKEAEKQEEEKKSNQLMFDTGDLYSKNSSTFRAESAGGVFPADSAQTLDPPVKTADGKFVPGKKGADVQTADHTSAGQKARTGENNRNFKDSLMTIDQQMQSGLGGFDSPFQSGTDSIKPDNPQPRLREKAESTHTVQKGDSLDKITRRTLGKNASDSQRQSFEDAVRSINKLEPGQQLEKGRQLKLPGIDQNGDFTHKDGDTTRKWNPQNGLVETTTGDGTRITNYKDKSTRIETPDGDSILTRDGSTTVIKKDRTIIESNKDGESTTTPEQVTVKRAPDGKLKSVDTGHQIAPHESGSDGHGGRIDRNQGNRREENFALIQTKDGRMEVADRGPDGKDRISELRPDESLKEPRKELIEKAEKQIKDPAELARFKADMVRFEQRSADRGMSDKQVSDTYKEIGRLLDGGKNDQVGSADRIKIAGQVMSNAANPEAIDQGGHKSCSVASVEHNVYTKDPAAAARMVADMTLTGQYTAKDGTTVKAPEGTFRPDHESAKHPVPDGERGLASQIFQITAVNLYHKGAGTGMEYKQVPVAPQDREKDSGERLIDQAGNEAGREPRIPDSGIGKLSEQITGKPEEVLSNSKSGGPNGQGTFTKPEELGQKLEQLKKDGKLPAIIVIHTGNHPFDHGNKGEWHAMNVTDYDAEKGEVKLDNQWGGAKDKHREPVKLEDLFKATMSPADAKDWQAQQDFQKGKQERNETMEKSINESPSTSERFKEISDMEKASQAGTRIGAKELIKFMDKAGPEWKAQKENGTFDQKDQDQTLHKLGKLFDKMPLSEKMEFLNHMGGPNAKTDTRNSMPQSTFNDLFGRAITDQGWNRRSMEIQLDVQKRHPEYGNGHRAKDEQQMFSTLKSLPEEQQKDIINRLPPRSKHR